GKSQETHPTEIKIIISDYPNQLQHHRQFDRRNDRAKRTRHTRQEQHSYEKPTQMAPSPEPLPGYIDAACPMARVTLRIIARERLASSSAGRTPHPNRS